MQSQLKNGEYYDQHFGIQAAVSFYEGLLTVFAKIVDNPVHFTRIDEIRGFNEFNSRDIKFVNLLNIIERFRMGKS